MSDDAKLRDQPADPAEVPHVELIADPANLEQLGADASFVDSDISGGAETLVLGLEDLLPDMDGAVVMMTDEHFPVSLVTSEPLAESGIVDQPAIASGMDVEGLYYYSFANGVTLYSDTDIVIVSEALTG